jgi:hypothetical protein
VTAIDWFSLLHPVLVILFVYPVVGATIRLGILVREKRLGITQQPALVPREHADHGRWFTASVVVVVLIALVYSFISRAVEPGADFAGGLLRLSSLLLVAAGTLVALLVLLKVKQPPLRASFTLLSDNPFSASFWSSHYWSGVLLTGLLLFDLAARPEITRHLRWRRLHVASNLLIMVLLAVQAITGCRDLLEIPLSWQKPAIYRCDFQNRTCPEPVAAPAAAVPSSGAAVAPSLG